jgi:hypothetical protein
LAVNSPIVIHPELSTAELLTIDRGADAEYRFIVNVGGNSSKAMLKEAELDATQGYTVVFAHQYDNETGILGEWGYLILKK